MDVTQFWCESCIVSTSALTLLLSRRPQKASFANLPNGFWRNDSPNNSFNLCVTEKHHCASVVSQQSGRKGTDNDVLDENRIHQSFFVETQDTITSSAYRTHDQSVFIDAKETIRLTLGTLVTCSVLVKKPPLVQLLTWHIYGQAIAWPIPT